MVLDGCRAFHLVTHRALTELCIQGFSDRRRVRSDVRAGTMVQADVEQIITISPGDEAEGPSLRSVAPSVAGNT